jgi:SAM-dependent methyltransferase
MTSTTMTDAFFGELYLRSTLPFLTEAVTSAEVRFLSQWLPKTGRVLDLGCGHGRHLRAFSNAYGVDFDAGSLREARAFRPVARADFAALPFKASCFEAGYAWYNTLSTFDTAHTAHLLREASRCLKPGARFLLQGSNPRRAIEHPHALWDGTLSNGCHLHEETTYSFERARDEIDRRLTLPDGRVMAAKFFIHYYDLDGWRGLLSQAGLQVAWASGGVDGSPFGDHSNDVILGAEKRGD